MIAPMIYSKNSGYPRNLLLIDIRLNKGHGFESYRVVEIVFSHKIDCLGTDQDYISQKDLDTRYEAGSMICPRGVEL